MKKLNSIRNVLVTGGAGYVGSVLVPKLLQKGYQVKVIDWFIYGDTLPKHKKLIKIKGDIRDKKKIKESLRSSDAVLHLASISNDPSFELNPSLGKSVNYDATKLIADMAKKSGVSRFVFASTSSVYGVKTEKEVTEDLPLEPLTDYSKYKAISEPYLLNKNDNNFSVLVLRPATVCGYSPRMRLDLTVNILTIQALVNKKMTIFGGSQLRPNIHIEDMTDLYLKTLEYPKDKIAGKIFNAGYENYSVITIAEKIKRVLKDKKIKIEVSPTNDLRSYKIGSKKIKEELGFVAKKSVEEAILDIKKAYEEGLITDPLHNESYYNIKTMKAARIK